ncbi:hypothetical protein COPCOM_01534 [Coprococcus comes ATCC 27758]|uniref:Uncharacterized protein n=1 Tax=Coprococcus comes ATCC 27758 TaxID=470146 RepID=C0B8R0_9FIRM|nr:hypothetical protein COPCOM_01534 [Coprococcus comes ATCC 27758]
MNNRIPLISMKWMSGGFFYREDFSGKECIPCFMETSQSL